VVTRDQRNIDYQDVTVFKIKRSGKHLDPSGIKQVAARDILLIAGCGMVACESGQQRQRTAHEYRMDTVGATAPIWALAYLHETLRFTSVY
jgi:hypothetical protein